MHTICDARADRLEEFHREYPGAKLKTSADEVLADPDVDAVAIATPVHTHFALASASLRAGKHVLIEKPMAAKARECEELIAQAEQRQLTLMVGHVFLYNSAVQKVKEYIETGELGEIYYVYAQRLNLGIVRQDVDALWNFAPHDFSILHYWLNDVPEWTNARGFSYLQPGIKDVVFVTMGFPSGVGANVHISWLDPHKVRTMTVVGSKKMVVYDDVSTDARIIVYDKGVLRTEKPPIVHGALTSPMGDFASLGEFQLLVRAGDVLIPKIDFAEPLKVECQHFVDCVRTGARPLSDGYNGLRVVQMLEAAQASMDRAENSGSHKQIRV